MKRFFLITVFVILSFTSLFAAFDSPQNTVKAFESYLDTIKDYKCTLHEVVYKGKKMTDIEWKYAFTAPKYIYMEAVKGDRLGSKAFFDCETEKVTGRQGGALAVVKLTLPLTNGLVKNIRGITIAESDWPYVLNRTKNILAENGAVASVSEGVFNGKDVTVLKISGFSAEKYRFDSTSMYFTQTGELSGFRNYENGQLVEDILYKDIQINTGIKKEDLYVK